MAAAAAYGLDLSERDLSRLARRGSGSATRSIPGGVSVWHAGDDAGSFAETVPAPPMAMVVVTINDGPKEIGSREAMRRTIATSPFYPAWVSSTTETVGDMLAACAAGDFTRIGELTESNALRMHATIEGAFPPIRYLTSRSVAVFDAVVAMRADGIEAYATADAGPNVVVLCRPEDRAPRGRRPRRLRRGHRVGHRTSRSPAPLRRPGGPPPSRGERSVIEFRAHGKLFVAGEYAVVEPGQPSVLIALDRAITARVSEGHGAGSVHSEEYGNLPLTWTRPRTASRSTASTTPTTT